MEIAPFCDFQGRWEESENLPLVFLAFHGPPFPPPVLRAKCSCHYQLASSLVTLSRPFYPHKTAKSQFIDTWTGVRRVRGPGAVASPDHLSSANSSGMPPIVHGSDGHRTTDFPNGSFTLNARS